MKTFIASIYSITPKTDGGIILDVKGCETSFHMSSDTVQKLTIWLNELSLKPEDVFPDADFFIRGDK